MTYGEAVKITLICFVVMVVRFSDLFSFLSDFRDHENNPFLVIFNKIFQIFKFLIFRIGKKQTKKKVLIFSCCGPNLLGQLIFQDPKIFQIFQFVLGPQDFLEQKKRHSLEITLTFWDDEIFESLEFFRFQEFFSVPNSY